MSLGAAKVHPPVSAERRAGIALPAVLGGCAVVALAALPWVAGSYQIDAARDALLFGLLALSLDYLWGKAGILSFGHAAFFGLGGYAVAIVGPMLEGPNAALVGIAAGIGMATTIALAVGYFLLFAGIRGPYLTVVTLALSLVAEHIAISWSSMTGGNSGLIGAPQPGIDLGVVSGMVDTSPGQYALALVVLGIVLAVLWSACRGRYGRMLTAIQENEAKLQSLGYNTSAHLLVVFCVSAAIAALAGGLYVSVSGFAGPDLVGLNLSTEIIVWVAVGGRGTLVGPILGALLVLRLHDYVSSLSLDMWPILIGCFFVATVFLFPSGLLPFLVSRLGGRRAGRIAEQRR